jgi:hypothetical protein
MRTPNTLNTLRTGCSQAAKHLTWENEKINLREIYQDWLV